MQQELNQRLKTQIKIAWSQLILSGVVLIGIVMILASTVTSFFSGDFVTMFSGGFNTPLPWIALGLMLFAAIPKGVLWIVGIIKAAKINTMTDGRNVSLVAFAVFTFVFIHLIMAYEAQKKESRLLEDVKPIDEVTVSKDIRLKKLKDAFVNDVITLKEYEIKKKMIETENK